MTTDPIRRDDRYLLVRELGQGGFGRVYVAMDQVLHREVALKELRADLADGTEHRRRLLREVQITSQLEHPGIVPVYDLAAGTGGDSGSPYYTMRLVRGQKLKDAIAAYHQHRGTTPDPLALPRLVTALVAICNAIGYAHSRGVMHRDLKPDNVVLGEFGEVVLLDWGVARMIDEDGSGERAAVQLSSDDARRTIHGAASGTPAYMAPEQARGRPGPATDVYGLGAILFELLTGRAPHDGHDSTEVMQRILAGPTPRARELAPGAPAALDAICARAMAWDPAARYPSPAALADELQRYLADEPVSAHRESVAARTMRWMRRHGSWTLAVVVAVTVTVLVTSLAAVRLAALSHREREARLLADAAREQALGVAARFAARTVAGEIDVRWRILEAAAGSPVPVAALRQALAADVVDPAALRPLQAWLEARHRAHSDTTTATSWFVTDARGRHLARSPLDPEILGRDFSFRDYFHGGGRDLPPGGAAPAPITDVHRSVVFESQATHNLIVAFSVPIWSGDAADREVLGVLAMTVELGHFAALQIDLESGQTAVLVETESDWVEGPQRSGLILHHPRQQRGRIARLSEDLLQRMRAARRHELAPAVGVQRPPGILRDHRDPLSVAADQRWSAAFAPVLVKGRAPAQRDTGWVVLVQEPASARAE